MCSVKKYIEIHYMCITRESGFTKEESDEIIDEIVELVEKYKATCGLTSTLSDDDELSKD